MAQTLSETFSLLFFTVNAWLHVSVNSNQKALTFSRSLFHRQLQYTIFYRYSLHFVYATLY